MRARKVDDNQASIVKALRKAGCSVWITSALGEGGPDLVVGVSGGRNGCSHVANYLIEIKDGSKPPSRQKLTDRERKFKAEWKGGYFVVRNIDEALVAVGLAK